MYNPKMRRMMVVTAHPDDEASSFGGSLCFYRERGVETCVVCLTAGQAATYRGGAHNDQELGAKRREEFAAACKVLKVSQGMVLDYPDGQLHRLDLQRVVSDLTLRIREFRPQIVLTFDPAGGVTGHTDHSLASVFATLAFHWAGRNNRFIDQLSGPVTPHRAQKLYHATADFSLPGRQPITLAPATTVIEIGDYLETKIEAFRAHVSQQPLWPLFEEYARKRGMRELFHLAASVNTGLVAQESDLFAGITPESA
ncbi:MAG: PIG-L deacetylase family protein [Terriglobales bacterium]